MHRTRIALCYGTRPQVIKASVLREHRPRAVVIIGDTNSTLCLLEALASLDRPVLLALHPRPQAALDAAGIEPRFGRGLTTVPPVGYLESLALARAAEMAFTDSGGLQREAYWMGTPCVTLRRETEWIETVEEGANIPTDPAGGAAQRIVSALEPLVR